MNAAEVWSPHRRQSPDRACRGARSTTSGRPRRNSPKSHAAQQAPGGQQVGPEPRLRPCLMTSSDRHLTRPARAICANVTGSGRPSRRRAPGPRWPQVSAVRVARCPSPGVAPDQTARSPTPPLPVRPVAEFPTAGPAGTATDYLDAISLPAHRLRNHRSDLSPAVPENGRCAVVVPTRAHTRMRHGGDASLPQGNMPLATPPVAQLAQSGHGTAALPKNG